jgi:hypothetical protein
MDHFSKLRNNFFRRRSGVGGSDSLEFLAVGIGHTIPAFVEPEFTTEVNHSNKEFGGFNVELNAYPI